MGVAQGHDVDKTIVEAQIESDPWILLVKAGQLGLEQAAECDPRQADS